MVAWALWLEATREVRAVRKWIVVLQLRLSVVVDTGRAQPIIVTWVVRLEGLAMHHVGWRDRARRHRSVNGVLSLLYILRFLIVFDVDPVLVTKRRHRHAGRRIYRGSAPSYDGTGSC